MGASGKVTSTPVQESAHEHSSTQTERAPSVQNAALTHPLLSLQRSAGNRFVGNRLMRQSAEESEPEPGPATEAAMEHAGEGSPLPANLRARMEQALGTDLSDVRIHTDDTATSATTELQADAFTSGSDIFFAENQFQPGSFEGERLLSHEVAHTVQQESAPAMTSVQSRPVVSQPGDPLEVQAEQVSQRIAEGESVSPNLLDSHSGGPTAQIARQPVAEPATTTGSSGAAGSGGQRNREGGAEPGLPNEEISLTTGTFAPSEAVGAYLEAQRRNIGKIRVRFGNLARGEIEVHKAREIYNTTGNRPQAIPLIHPALVPVVNAGITPVLAVRVQRSEIRGYVSIASSQGAAGNPAALVDWIKSHSEEMGWAGIDIRNFPRTTNSIDGGVLRLAVSNFRFQLGGFMEGSGDFGLENENVTFNADAALEVPGVTSARMSVERTSEGVLNGRLEVPVSIEKFSGNVLALYNDGIVDVTGTARYSTEKLDGEVTLLVTDAATARDVALQRLGPDAVEASAEEASGESTGSGPRPGPRALAGWGELDFRFTEWMTGKAQVIVDNEGNITVVGEIAPPAEVLLFPQEDYIYPLFKIEVRTVYGIPLVGNLFLFANAGMDALAKLGPAKIYNIRVEGTYSTDPRVFNRFSIEGTLNISAFAGLRLRAEGGAGIQVAKHDVKAGAGIEGLAGVRGYVEATPTFGFREVADPDEGKEGEFYIRGHMEIAAQPFLGLSGDLFVELDSPWWSPAPDKKWTWPVGQLEYPLPGEFGIGADVDYVIGSGELPEVQFGKVDFNASKFMTDLMNDHIPPKSQGEQEQLGEWQEDEITGESAEPQAIDTEGAVPEEPAQGQTEPSDGEVPSPALEAQWQQGLEALEGIAERSRQSPFSQAEIESTLASLRSQYSFTTLRATQSGEDWLVHASMNPELTGVPVKGKPEEGEPAEADAEAAADVPLPNLTSGDLIEVMTRDNWLTREFVAFRTESIRDVASTYLEYKVPGGKGLVPVSQQGESWRRYHGTGGINYGSLDQHGRPTGIEATIVPTMITDVYSAPAWDPPGYVSYAAGHVRAHLLGSQLGGSGKKGYPNLVTLYVDVNSPTMRGYENRVRNAVDSGEIVTYKVTPIYTGTELIPKAITIEANGSLGFSLSLSILNRA
jgi:hypothetical protein